MDLGLDVRVRGPVPREVAVVYERDLTEEDVKATQLPRATPQPLLTRLKDRHHNLARYVAAGMTDVQAAMICGYRPDRVSVLRADPMFQDLVAFYHDREAQEFDTVGEKLTNVAGEALAIIIDRLEEDSDKISMTALIDLVKLGADRTGYGPASSQTNLNVNVGVADKLAAARERVKAAKALRVVNPAPEIEHD